MSLFRVVLIAAVFAVLILAGSQESLTAKKLGLRAKLGLLSSLFAKEGEAELEALRSENLALRAALEMRKEFETLLPDLSERGIPVGAYSSYPFNFKNVITLSVGAEQGIKSGATAVFGGVLAGKVEEVSEKTSILRTVFDPRFELPVRIGPKGVDALLKGGAKPLLTLIAKDAAVVSGDIVTSADPSVPFGLAVGEVGEVINEASAPFNEAELNLPYAVSALRVLAVLAPMAR